MARRRTDTSGRRGFTLVELLVVITIIGMLMGIIIPAATQVVEMARRTKCAARQKDLATALQAYESPKGFFPGYANELRDAGGASGSGNVVRVSWVVAIFPYIQKQDLYDAILSSQVDESQYDLDQFVCPSDPPAAQRTAPLSYVVNTGRRDQGAGNSCDRRPDRIANGVFHRHTRTCPQFRSIRLDDIHDGAGQTILLTENLQASTWSVATEEAVGCVWWEEERPSESNEAYYINGDRGYRNTDIQHARPSSNHPGGANIVWCNAGSKFLSERIDYSVYCRILTTYDRKAGPPGDNSRGPEWLWRRPFNPADLDP